MAKVFLYLDEYKMYSLSSQLFEGLTEEVVQYTSSENREEESQKGPVGSGKLLADIVAEQRGRQERRFLHDYAYTVFEQQLLDQDKVLDVEQAKIPEVADFRNASFVKVAGPITFSDMAAVQAVTKEFNRMMTALNYVSTAALRDAMKVLLELQMESAKGQQKSSLERQLKELLKPDKSTTMDPQFLSELSYMLEYAYGDHLEAQVRFPKDDRDINLFTAILDRASLREPADRIVKKYSRQSEQALTIFGIVTQHSTVPKHDVQVPGESTGGEDTDREDENDPQHLKIAIANMVEQLGHVEATFTGRLPDEIIIDPIAIYREL